MITKTNSTHFTRRAFHVLFALIFGLSVAGMYAQEARAGTTYTVINLNNSGPGSLRQAILDANGNAAADTIQFSVSGKILLSSSLPAINGDLTINGTGYTIAISGENAFRVFYIGSSADVEMNKLTIMNGSADQGGGIYVAAGGSLSVANSTLSNNSAHASTCGNLVVESDEGCDDGNLVSGDGCSSACAVELGFNCTGSPSVCVSVCGDGIVASGEGCDDGNLVSGDGCSSACAVELGFNCTGSPSVCVSPCGDGIVASDEGCDDGNLISGDGCSSACVVEPGYHCVGSPSVCLKNVIRGNRLYTYFDALNGNENSSIRLGSASGNGGGIYNNGGSVVVTNSTFSGNSAGYGGGIYNNLGIATVVNSTFSGNNVTKKGGGIYNNNNLTVTNSTLSGNTAGEYGGGIYNAGSNLNITNSIIANSGGGSDCWSEIVFPSAMNSIIESVIACGTPLTTNDPKLGSLANNGGPTRTFTLLPGSPAIDTGDDTTCSAAPVNNHDQRGVTRPFGAHCDIGSYEQNKGTLTTQSVGAYDGWILESGENSNAGGTRDSTSTTLNLGDEVGDKQYRTVLSFNTASLPDNAVITKATLKIKKMGLSGTNPFTILGGLKVDIRKPFFGTTLALVTGDFQAVPGKSGAGTFGTTPVSNWYSAVIGSAGYPFIHKAGTTQFRLYFTKDDNDDGDADYMKFYSGNYTYAASRPMLVIEYYVP